MYPKNFIDYKLYIRRLSLPNFITDWFGGKNACYNKISREALKNNLDINELLLNVIFIIINELDIESDTRDQIIGNVINTMIEKQHNFESFKYYKYAEKEYQNKLNALHLKYQELLDNYQLEMSKIVQEREMLRKIEDENSILKEKIFDLEKSNLEMKNIHDSKDKEMELLKQELEYKLDEKQRHIQDLQQELIKEKDHHNVLIIDYENQKSKDLTELIDKFEVNFNLLKKQKDDINIQLDRTLAEKRFIENKYNEISSQKVELRQINANNNTSENREFNRISETLDAVTKALSMATSELENRCRDNVLPKQFTRYTESIELCLSPIGLYKYVNPQYLKDKNKKHNYNRNHNNQSRNNYQNRSSNYHERRNDNSSTSSSSNVQNTNSSKRYWKPDIIKNSPGIKAVYETVDK